MELVHAGSALDFWLLGQDSVRLGDRWDTPCVRTLPLECCLSVRPWAEVRQDGRSLDVSGCRACVFCIVGSRLITPLAQMLSQLFFVFVRLRSSVCLIISSETSPLYRGMGRP